jgi:tetratricopeptide (TPR) repeat protein
MAPRPDDHLPDPTPDERDSAYDLFHRGTRMLADQHPGAAAVLLERALVLEPGKASILEALGQAYFNGGSHELAAERFGAIVEADPLAHYAHFGLGLSRARLGDAGLARRHLRMAVFLKPDNESYQRALARLEHAA